MSEHIKTTEELLIISNDYNEKWVSLDWLKEQIREKEKELTKENELHCYSVIKGLHLILSLLEV